MEETFRNYNDHLSFSNYGNIMEDGRLIEPGKDKLGYQYVCTDGKAFRVHTIIGKLFQDICGEWKPGYHTHHIDRNRNNNVATNLINLSPSEHKKLHQFEDGVTKSVIGLDKYGNVVGVYGSLTDAQDSNDGAWEPHIYRVCTSERKTAGGLFWVFSDDPDKDSKIQEWKYQCLTKRIDGYRKKEGKLLRKLRAVTRESRSWNEDKHCIYATEIRTGTITKIKSIVECCNLYGMTEATLCRNLKTNGQYLYGDRVFWKK